MMKRACIKKIRLACVAFALVTFGASAARADMQAIRESDMSVWGSVGTSLFSYKEPAQAPNLPDSEHGWISSFAGGLSFLGNDAAQGLANNIYASLDGSVTQGDAHYNGAYFVFPTVPLQGTTSETVYTFTGKLGKAFPVGASVLATPYVELGYRYWQRKLSSVQVEDYQHFDTLGGIMLQIAPTNRLILTGYGAGGTTFSPQMSTGGYVYNLGNAGEYKLGGKVGYDVTNRVELFTSLDYDYFRYGQSPIVNGAYEPNSHTEDTTWRVGVGYHFK